MAAMIVTMILGSGIPQASAAGGTMGCTLPGFVACTIVGAAARGRCIDVYVFSRCATLSIGLVGGLSAVGFGRAHGTVAQTGVSTVLLSCEWPGLSGACGKFSPDVALTTSCVTVKATANSLTSLVLPGPVLTDGDTACAGLAVPLASPDASVGDAIAALKAALLADFEDAFASWASSFPEESLERSLFEALHARAQEVVAAELDTLTYSAEDGLTKTPSAPRSAEVVLTAG